MKTKTLLFLLLLVGNISKAQCDDYDNVFVLKDTQNTVPINRKFSLEFEKPYDVNYVFKKPVITDTSIVVFNTWLHPRPTNTGEPILYMFTAKKKGKVKITIQAEDSQKKAIVMYDREVYVIK